MLKQLSLFFSILGLLTSSAVAQNLQIDQQYGLWEGISASDGQFHLLELNQNKSHRYIVTPIGTGFKRAAIYPFTTQDMQCDNLNCTVQIPSPEKSSEGLRLITSADSTGGFNVMRIDADVNGNHLLSEQFQLKRTEGVSTVKRFLQQHHALLQSLSNEMPQDLTGVWLGVMTLDNQHDLLQLQINPGQSSRFIRYITGSQLTNETLFSDSDIGQQNGNYFIITTHPTFANKLIIHPISNTTLEGYFYSTYQNTSLQRGTFRLIRLGSPLLNPQN